MDSDQRRWRWLALLVLAGGLIWLLSPILTPFVLSALLAWLGNPLVLRLERAGRSRNTAVIIVFILMTLILVLSLVLIIPLLEEQIRELILWLPRLAEWTNQYRDSVAGNQVWYFAQAICRSDVIGESDQGALATSRRRCRHCTWRTQNPVWRLSVG